MSRRPALPALSALAKGAKSKGALSAASSLARCPGGSVGLQSPCDSLRMFARVVASAREGKPVEAWAFRPSKKRAKTQGLSPEGLRAVLPALAHEGSEAEGPPRRSGRRFRASADARRRSFSGGLVVVFRSGDLQVGGFGLKVRATNHSRRATAFSESLATGGVAVAFRSAGFCRALLGHRS